MAAIEWSLKVDWRKFQPNRKNLWISISAWAAFSLYTMLTAYFVAISGNSDIVVGGDHTAFHAAATGAAEGKAAEIYDYEYFGARLQEGYPVPEKLFLSWQYPPTYLLFILPLALLPYYVSFALWSTATAAGLGFVARSFIKDRLILFAIIVGPAAFTAFISGQNGFFTASLIALAAIFPKSRPIIAGVAAGILTVKPHLGLLIPVAYLLAGCWRAIAVAAITAITLALISFAAFGADTWMAFFTAVTDTSGRLTNGVMPVAKMATPLGAALFAGAPTWLAYSIYGLCLAACAVFVGVTWRRLSDPLLRAAALISCVLMAAPYGYHYELIILTIPGAIIIMRALETGWLRFERPLIIAAYILPIFFTATTKLDAGLSIGFVVTLIIFALTVRRVAHAAPGIFTVAGPTPAQPA